jgi:hypothetical protein
MVAISEKTLASKLGTGIQLCADSLPLEWHLLGPPVQFQAVRGAELRRFAAFDAGMTHDPLRLTVRLAPLRAATTRR